MQLKQLQHRQCKTEQIYYYTVILFRFYDLNNRLYTVCILNQSICPPELWKAAAFLSYLHNIYAFLCPKHAPVGYVNMKPELAHRWP